MAFTWFPLLAFAIFAGLAVGQLAIGRHEHRSGQAFVLFWPAPNWARDRNPMLFKGRLLLHWVFAAIFFAIALIFLAEFFGIVG